MKLRSLAVLIVIGTHISGEDDIASETWQWENMSLYRENLASKSLVFCYLGPIEFVEVRTAQLEISPSILLLHCILSLLQKKQ